MREIDLIPAEYRQRQRQRRRLVHGVLLASGLIASTAAARIWLDASISRMDAELALLQSEQAETVRQREELETLQGRQAVLTRQLRTLEGLRSGAPAEELFQVVSQALDGDDLWFRRWSFTRAGVTDPDGKAIDTGYFVVASNDRGAEEDWRVETHMSIAGQAMDHGALSQFVQRLLGHPEIRDVRIRRSTLAHQGNRSIVDFDLAVVINRGAR